MERMMVTSRKGSLIIQAEKVPEIGDVIEITDEKIVRRLDGNAPAGKYRVSDRVSDQNLPGYGVIPAFWIDKAP